MDKNRMPVKKLCCFIYKASKLDKKGNRYINKKIFRKICEDYFFSEQNIELKEKWWDCLVLMGFLKRGRGRSNGVLNEEWLPVIRKLVGENDRDKQEQAKEIL